MSIDVHVTKGGRIERGETVPDEKLIAHCTICDRDVDSTASLGTGHACAACLRERLDALSVARFRLRESAGKLPWGKITG